MKKTLIYISLLIVGLVAGIVATIVWYNYHPATEAQNHLQTWYYVLSMIGSIGTVAAVIVALFMDEIKSAMFHAKMDVTLFDEGDGCNFIESIDENEEKPSARHYECRATLTNNGNHVAEDCEVKLTGVTFRQREGVKERQLLPNSSCQVEWSKDEKKTTIYTKENRSITLFRVLPDNSDATPDSGKKSTKRIVVNGFSLPDNLSKSGLWIFSYKIVASQKELRTFTVKLNWDGSWRTRLSEMKIFLIINLEQQ